MELNETFIINIVSYDPEVELQNNATLVTILMMIVSLHLTK